MTKKISYSVFIILFSFLHLSAQDNNQEIAHTSNIKETIHNNKVEFNAELSQLRQIAGAPKAFWANYWEFGDGEYSFEKNPQHQYKENGNYTVRLSATNNYDDGKPPTTRPKSITIQNANDEASIGNTHNLIENYNGLRLQTNRDPRANEEIQVVLSYGNDQDYTTNGKLYVFFNEKKFKANNFSLTSVRTHFDEEETEANFVSKINAIKSKNDLIKTTGIETFINKKFLSDTTSLDLKNSLDVAKLFYGDYKVWNVNDVKPKEERNIFLSLKTTPEMLKDTSAIITIRSIYVPERGKNLHKITEKEMEIVTSHDPNKMSVYQTFLNYRLVRFKRLKYKVKFQNNGEGPASLIKLNVDIPEMLDKSTLKVIDMYPKVPLCPLGKKVNYSCMDTIIMKDKISFQFKNIYLPGTAQKGVTEKDSTKGFVKYSLKFGKDFHKKSSKSRTEIIFDKNEPIVTNFSTSRFKPGISIGVKAGYNHFFDYKEKVTLSKVADNINTNLDFDTKAKGFFLGATISPYKSYKWYLQAEIMAFSQILESTNLKKEHQTFIDTSTDTETNTKLEIQKHNLDIIPISVRYNPNAIFGFGFGATATLNGWQKTRTITDSKIKYFENQNTDPAIIEKHDCEIDYKKNLTFENYGAFVDLTIGASRIGPSVGFRYIQNFKIASQQIHTYVIWKF